MFYIVFAIAIIVTIFLTLNGYSYRSVSDEIRRLYSLSKNISEKTYSQKQLIGLPDPVKKYFQHVLKEGQPYISYVNLTHNGVFKSAVDEDWEKIDGQEYFTTERPGFLWQGKTDLFTATDKYINGRGKLKVSLLSFCTIVDANGKQYDESELLRWLGESVWFPTNLLPSENLSWSEIDNNSAKLNFNYKGMSVNYNVSFNEIGEIVQLETNRFMDNEKVQPWIGKLSDYKLLNNILIPSTLEASWILEEGEFSYAKFIIEEIDYQKSKN